MELSALSRQSDEDDIPDMSEVGEDPEHLKSRILFATPLEKRDEVKQKLKQVSTQADSENWENRSIIEAFDRVQEMVEFFVSVKKDLEKTLTTSQLTSEDITSMVDIFNESINLETVTFKDIYETKESFLKNIKSLLNTKEQISVITTSSEGFNIKEWVELLKKDPEGFSTKINQFLVQKEKDLKVEASELEGVRQAVIKILEQGLFSKKERERYSEQSYAIESFEDLKKMQQRLSRLNSRRQKTARKRYEQAVSDELDNPLTARQNLRSLRKKYGWGVLKFLNAENLYLKLKEIEELQNKRDQLEATLKKFSRERAEIEDAVGYTNQQLETVNGRLEELTGKSDRQVADGGEIIPFAQQEKMAEAGEVKEDSPEAITKKIEALQKTANAIREHWMEGASNCFPVGAKKREDLSGEFATDPQKYALVGGKSRIQFLKTHEDGSGQNLWDKYLRANKACAYETGKDHIVGLTDGEEWHPRPVRLDLDGFSLASAENLDKIITKYTSSKPELLFLAGDFFIDQQHNEKHVTGSPPAEVLEKIESKISELKGKISLPKAA